MKPNYWIACGALLASLSVAAGAFGVHGLTTRLRTDTGLSKDQADHLLDIFDKAARYHMYHALAVTFVGLVALRRPSPCLAAAGLLFVAGIVIFSGCLYAIALGGPRALGRVVPFGGASFIAGWICLAVAAWRLGGDNVTGLE